MHPHWELTSKVYQPDEVLGESWDPELLSEEDFVNWGKGNNSGN